MPDDCIHVATASTLTDCIRECVDFSTKYHQYVFQDCFGYNYEFDTDTCELIHSIEAMSYTVDFQTRWQTGFKN